MTESARVIKYQAGHVQLEGPGQRFPARDGVDSSTYTCPSRAGSKSTPANGAPTTCAAVRAI